ncbi:Hsp70 family protein, partial [Bacillus velezensis]|uniref:Hsp70 family protein n=1 Tax=Bacillus velezensis TaxID=492670 RepID=UPI001D0EB58F
MRATIDVGIDLGTTNSAVAVAEDGSVDVVKNNDNQHTTPSVVQLLDNGAVIVGRKAYEHYRAHGPGDAHAGAKRQMGKHDIRYPFAAAGVEFGPEDLAAEVLKSLRADAEMWVNEPVQAAVITVPAAFELAQCEATTRAAARAG